MERIKKYSSIFLAIYLAIILLVVPQLNNPELMNSTQSSKAFGFIEGMLIYVLIASIIGIIKLKSTIVKISIIDMLLGLYSLMVLTSYWLHPIDSLQMLTFGALVVFYLGVRVMDRKYQPLLLVAVAVSGTVQAIYGNLQLWGYYPSHHGIFRMTGSFFNPGPYAGYLAAIFPVALGIYLNYLNVHGFDGLNKTMFDRFSDSKGSNPSDFSNSEAFNPSNSEAQNNQTTKSSNIFNRIPINYRFFYNNGKGDTPEKLAERRKHHIDSTIQYFSLISMIVMCLVLPASRSRAAWLAVLVSAGYLFWIKYHPVSHLKARFDTPAKRLFLVSSIVFVLFLNGYGLYYFKKASADGRLLIWKVSAQMIKDQPIFGHGADKFTADYMNYQAAYFAPNPDVPAAIHADNITYAYNEFLKLTVEYGLIGVLLAVALLWSLFFLKTDNETNKSSSIPLLAARGGLLSIIVFAQFSYPSDILPIRMLFVLFVAIMANHQIQVNLFEWGRKKTALLPSQRKGFAGTAVLYAALAVALLAVYPASQYLTQQYNSYKSWKNASDIYNVGAYPECLEDFELAYPLLKTNGSFLVQYGKALEMAEKYYRSIELLNQAKGHLNNTILYTCLGNNYKALGKHSQAEKAYLHVWHMAPARFYPLYLIAKLFDETGQPKKAVEMAKKVMEKEVKIESTAIQEIQEEMRMIIEKHGNIQDMSNSEGKGRKHNHQVATASCPAPFLKKKVR